jgi:flagellar basal-body rod protein FlgG
VNTVAFKAGRVTFKEGFAQLLQGASRPPGDQGGINPVQIGLGMQIGSIDQIFNQGNLESTGLNTDVAIQGDSFFVVRKGNQSFYTRAGNFALDAGGQIVTNDGYTLEPAITIPQGARGVSIAQDGTVQAVLQGQTAAQTLGQIQLAAFVNPAGLEAQGDNLFLATTASGDPTVGAPGSEGVGSLTQGFLETSNVNAVEEISSLIVAQRAYEMNARVITAADDMLQATSQLR